MFCCFCFAGSCTFDEGFTQCDYQQDPYDDFDWTHINTQDVPYVSPDLPHGKDSSSPLHPPNPPNLLFFILQLIGKPQRDISSLKILQT